MSTTFSSVGKNAVIPIAPLNICSASKRLMRDRAMVNPDGVVETSGSERVVKNGEGNGMIWARLLISFGLSMLMVTPPLTHPIDLVNN